MKGLSLMKKWRYLIRIPLFTLGGIIMIACEPEASRLGIDMFPPSDNVLIYTDTIRDFKTMLVSSKPRVTSEPRLTPNNQREFLLGSKVDTITGFSKAEIVAQMCILRTGIFGDEPHVDSLKLSIYMSNVEGDTSQDMRIRIYELTDRIFYDSTYYSDYNVEGKYDPEPLVDKVIKPRPGVYNFNIEDEDLRRRITEAASDTVFNSNALFQETFGGFYMTTDPVEEGGTIAKFQLANSVCGLRFRYLHDSVLIDTATEAHYSWYSTSFNEKFAQKINIFKHDFSGTSIEQLIDNPDAKPTIGYAQGMAGVNLKITLSDISEYFQNDTVALNAAKILFYILPDSISGINESDYPKSLMMGRFVDGEYKMLYDYVTNENPYYFGRLSQSNERSAFLPPLYFYNFQIGRHLQSVLSYEIENSELHIYVNNPNSTSKYIKFWNNYSGLDRSLRLELIYTVI